ncbi:MAG: tRNA (adenosine(37)-N6)-threonylcarbamoyltransferase complex ATPase subunit type 1 TsaE [Actinobacteria bacterium]|nr:tRNA (adenosine(37)-N6)-threonylcarbamoyltransferase complex ATPase subunit type 1 TsaE [Actinomycetota bacterium]MCL5445264.1 tRNA (adenosine(37)-N6)-threonylcarbamoyltransferase complex ATPase subunit type 1 TsaE [Actinomycetota bacterium]
MKLVVDDDESCFNSSAAGDVAGGDAGGERWRLDGVTRSLEETWRLASRVAEVLRRGDLVLLTGELGAGKTAFAQGVARALRVEEAVTSPTFTLVHEYNCSFQEIDTLLHADLYRLETPGEVEELGLAEMLDYGAVGLVEWGERGVPVLGESYLEVHMEALDPGSVDAGDVGEYQEVRLVTCVGVGRSWARRGDALRHSIEEYLLDRDVEGGVL